MLVITRECSFDAAHLLTGHGGQCRNLHGHTYHVTVELSDASAHLGSQPDDMVMDFKDLKRVMQEALVAPLDHAFIYDETSSVEIDIAETLTRHGLRVYPLPFRSTSENLARHFFGLLREKGLPVSAVSVSETPASCATYRE